jgi:putative redox protein
MIKVHKAEDGKLKQILEIGNHQLIADEPVSVGGDDQGPGPTEFLQAALGSCTAITVTMVAQRKQMPLKDVRVQVSMDKTADATKFHREIEFVGDLTAEQREYLLGIANKCPVHKILSGKIEIDTVLQGS